MRKEYRVVVLAIALFATAGCSIALPQGESGSIPFIPVFNEELSIQGMVPVGCEREDADSHNCSSVSPDRNPLIIVQAALPGSEDELEAIVLEQTALSQVPEPTGRYRGSAFLWNLFAFETQLRDSGPQTFHIDLALAHDGEAGYLVAMITLPEDYANHEGWYDTVFTHVVYALSPMA